ncbi:MAG: hypothetical protein L3J69_06310 [Desulfobacula sp.]|nr:hypothetical protein [Desulfobacula sp.]
MQQKTIMQKCIMALISIAWVAGLLMAGSENPYMPWANGFGLLLFLLASLLLSKRLGSSKSNTLLISFPKIKQSRGRAILHNAKSNQRIKIWYAQ